MLDCDGWERATAYHDAFDSTVLGHPVAAVTTNFAGVVNVMFAGAGWSPNVVLEATSPDRNRRGRFALCLLKTARDAAGVEV